MKKFFSVGATLMLASAILSSCKTRAYNTSSDLESTPTDRNEEYGVRCMVVDPSTGYRGILLGQISINRDTPAYKLTSLWSIRLRDAQNRPTFDASRQEVFGPRNDLGAVVEFNLTSINTPFKTIKVQTQNNQQIIVPTLEIVPTPNRVVSLRAENCTMRYTQKPLRQTAPLDAKSIAIVFGDPSDRSWFYLASVENNNGELIPRTDIRIEGRTACPQGTEFTYMQSRTGTGSTLVCRDKATNSNQRILAEVKFAIASEGDRGGPSLYEFIVLEPGVNVVSDPTGRFFQLK